MYYFRAIVLIALCLSIVIFSFGHWHKLIQRQPQQKEKQSIPQKTDMQTHNRITLHNRLNTVLQDWLVRHPSSPGVQCAIHAPPTEKRRVDLSLTIAIESKTFKTTHKGVRPLRTDTPWRVASITKTFVSTAVLKLCESGVLDLDAPAELSLPEWATVLLKSMTMTGQNESNRVSVRMLLQHTSGLYDHSVDPALDKRLRSDPQHRWTARELLNFAAEHGKPVARPGERFHYSDTGYIFLGTLIEHVTGTDLAVTIRKLTEMDSLKLSSTWWEIFEDAPKSVPNEKANQYVGDEDVSDFDGSFDSYGGGGLISNSIDLNKFTFAVHRGDMLGWKIMRQIYKTVPLDPESYIAPELSEYGLGWIKSNSNGHVIWWHLGFWGSWTGYVPSMELVFSGTFNQGDNPFALASLILKVILDDAASGPHFNVN